MEEKKNPKFRKLKVNNKYQIGLFLHLIFKMATLGIKFALFTTVFFTKI